LFLGLGDVGFLLFFRVVSPKVKGTEMDDGKWDPWGMFERLRT